MFGPLLRIDSSYVRLRLLLLLLLCSVLASLNFPTVAAVMPPPPSLRPILQRSWRAYLDSMATEVDALTPLAELLPETRNRLARITEGIQHNAAFVEWLLEQEDLQQQEAWDAEFHLSEEEEEEEGEGTAGDPTNGAPWSLSPPRRHGDDETVVEVQMSRYSICSSSASSSSPPFASPTSGSPYESMEGLWTQLVRDYSGGTDKKGWGGKFYSERGPHHRWLRAELQRVADVLVVTESSSTSDEAVRVLLPGVGTGALAFEVLRAVSGRRALDITASECSHLFGLTSAVLLRRMIRLRDDDPSNGDLLASQDPPPASEPSSLLIAPWLSNFASQREVDKGQTALHALHFDLEMPWSPPRPQPNRVTIVLGDALAEGWSQHLPTQQRALPQYQLIVLFFVLDAMDSGEQHHHSLLTTLDRLVQSLQPGGFLLLLGPLQYHFAGLTPKLTLPELLACLRYKGLVEDRPVTMLDEADYGLREGGTSTTIMRHQPFAVTFRKSERVN